MTTGERRRRDNDGSWCWGTMALIRASCGWSTTMKLSWMWRSWDKQSAPLCVKRRYAHRPIAMLLACSRARLGFFLLSTFCPRSHENHVGIKHSAWLVPVQLVAIERSADSSRIEKGRAREKGGKEDREKRESLATLAEWPTRTNWWRRWIYEIDAIVGNANMRFDFELNDS